MWSHRSYAAVGEVPDHVLKLRRSAQEPVIGRLSLQTEQQFDMWPKVESDEDKTLGRIIEVVAINRYVEHSKTFNETLQRYDYPITRKEGFTVLWVEWKGDVAYRLACGRIDGDGWRSLAPQEIDLVLG